MPRDHHSAAAVASVEAALTETALPVRDIARQIDWLTTPSVRGILITLTRSGRATREGPFGLRRKMLYRRAGQR